MPVFQSCPYHVDNVIKRKPNKNDIEFLSTLQTILNTQNNMGNADPIFWVIAGRKKIKCNDDDGPDEIQFWFNYECYDLTDADDIEAFQDAIKDQLGIDVDIQSVNKKVNLRIHDPSDDYTEEYTNIDLISAIKKLNDCLMFELLIIRDVDIVPIKYSEHIYPDTFFLTHEAAEDHLKTNGHNYDPTAHAYAMTAVRSPQVETLWRLLRELDFSSWKGVNP